MRDVMANPFIEIQTAATFAICSICKCCTQVSLAVMAFIHNFIDSNQ